MVLPGFYQNIIQNPAQCSAQTDRSPDVLWPVSQPVWQTVNCLSYFFYFQFILNRYLHKIVKDVYYTTQHSYQYYMYLFSLPHIMKYPLYDTPVQCSSGKYNRQKPTCCTGINQPGKERFLWQPWQIHKHTRETGNFTFHGSYAHRFPFEGSGKCDHAFYRNDRCNLCGSFLIRKGGFHRKCQSSDRQLAFILSMILCTVPAPLPCDHHKWQGNSSAQEAGSHHDLFSDCRKLYSGLHACASCTNRHSSVRCRLVSCICRTVSDDLLGRFPKWLNSTIYIAMGWLCIFAIRSIYHFMSPQAFTWLFAGGVIYTIGGVIYALKLPVFNKLHPGFGGHEIFHLFVMGGSLCHFIMVYGYLLS